MKKQKLKEKKLAEHKKKIEAIVERYLVSVQGLADSCRGESMEAYGAFVPTLCARILMNIAKENPGTCAELVSIAAKAMAQNLISLQPKPKAAKPAEAK